MAIHYGFHYGVQVSSEIRRSHPGHFGQQDSATASVPTTPPGKGEADAAGADAGAGAVSATVRSSMDKVKETAELELAQWVATLRETLPTTTKAVNVNK